MTLFNIQQETIVGVSVTLERGLEVAVLDHKAGVIIKYAHADLVYDNARKQIADLDIFKETLGDVFAELEIKKGSKISLSIPSTEFKISDYPASLEEDQLQNVIEEELTGVPLFQGEEPCFDAALLPNSTMQFNKIVYGASSKSMLIEVAMQLQEMGYDLVSIDCSVNSTINSLIYTQKIGMSDDFSWVLLLIEEGCCRIIPMLGHNYIDYFEEKIAIGEVLGDAENYKTVIETVTPLLKNLPSSCLYVVSKTDVISAEALASQITYNSQIVHLEANNFARELPIDVAPDAIIDAKIISYDVIGAAAYSIIKPKTSTMLNLFNASLGDVYNDKQPLSIRIGGSVFVLSVQNMAILSSIIGGILLVTIIIALIFLTGIINKQNEQLDEMTTQINAIDQKLAQNKNISTSLFDEGDEIKIGLGHNKNVYSYYTIVGTEIPQKLWLTSLKLGSHTTIEGQADNLQSIYSFFRNIKDYDPSSKIQLQKLGLASKAKTSPLNEAEDFDTASILTSLNADFYEFRISDAPEENNLNEKTDKGKAAETPPLVDLPEQ